MVKKKWVGWDWLNHRHPESGNVEYVQLKITDAVSDLFLLVSAKPLFTGFSSETNIYSSQLLCCFILFSIRNLIMCLDMLSSVTVGKHIHWFRVLGLACL